MFELGKIYRRSVLHDQYGGNRQGGISNCANYPYILIFSSQAGEQHGYDDGWDKKNHFYYTGEGQSGDMTFTRGNAALRDHVSNGKSVYLFESESKGLWKYIDELELLDYEYFDTPDTQSLIRKGLST